MPEFSPFYSKFQSIFFLKNVLYRVAILTGVWKLKQKTFEKCWNFGNKKNNLENLKFMSKNLEFSNNFHINLQLFGEL